MKIRESLSTVKEYTSSVFAYLVLSKVSGKRILVIDIPDSSYIKALLNNSSLTTIPDLSMVLHLSPDKVLKLPEYMAWMEMFPNNQSGEDPKHISRPKVKHIMLDQESVEPLSFNYRMHHKKLREAKKELKLESERT